MLQLCNAMSANTYRHDFRQGYASSAIHLTFSFVPKGPQIGDFVPTYASTSVQTYGLGHKISFPAYLSACASIQSRSSTRIR
jgi:hypothetical protein